MKPLILLMEPVVGIEPTTDGLQNRSSTTELNWPPKGSSCLFQSGALGKSRLRLGLRLLAARAVTPCCSNLQVGLFAERTVKNVVPFSDAAFPTDVYSVTSISPHSKAP